jgi:hypothetical protein
MFISIECLDFLKLGGMFMKKGVIGILSVLLLIGLCWIVFGYGEVTTNYPANGSFIGATFLTGTNMSVTIPANASFLTYNVELIVNGTGYGITSCSNGTACILVPNATLPQGVNYTMYANATNATYTNQTFITTISYDTVYPTLTYVGWAETNETVLGVGNETHDIVINVSYTELNFANATFTLLNTSSRLVLHTVNATSTSTNANFSGLPDGNYTFYVNITDLANNQNNTVSWRTVFLNATPFLDYGPESLANNSNITADGAYFNVSLVEYNLANITFLLINTSSNAVLNTTYYNATDYVASNMVVNFTNLSDGNYSVNITVRDTYNHKNTTINRFFTKDTTDPVPTITKSASTIEQTQTMNLTCAATDNIDWNPSVNLEVQVPGGSYTSVESGYKTVTDSYTATEVQGTYNVRCTAEDYTDHSEVVESSFMVEWASSGSSSSSGGSSGGGSSTSTETEEEEEEVIVEEEVVTETIVEAVNLDMNDQWVEEGVIELSGLVGGEEYSFATVDGADHSITIESVEGDTVVVVIASDPQTLTLTLVNPIGEVDLNGDGVNDLKVTLLGIVNGEASISVEQIDGLFEYPTSEKSYTWVWIVGILVVVLLVCLGLAYYFMQPKPKSKK